MIPSVPVNIDHEAATRGLQKPQHYKAFQDSDLFTVYLGVQTQLKSQTDVGS